MTLRLPTGTPPSCALPQPAGGDLSLHCSMQFLPCCLAATPLGSLLTAAASPLARAPAAALVKGSLLPRGPLLLQLDWQAPASPALVGGGWVGALQLWGVLHGAREAQLRGAAALLAALAVARPAVRLSILLCFDIGPARQGLTSLLCPGPQFTVVR